MKIKNGLQGVNRLSSSRSVRDPGNSADNSVSSEKDGVSLSEQSSFINALRVAAQGQEPSPNELIEEARLAIANGTLGTKEDFEQTINALLREL